MATVGLPDIYTVEDLLAEPGWPLGRSSTYEGIRNGQIPSVRIGRKILIPRVALERLLSGEAEGGGDGPG